MSSPITVTDRRSSPISSSASRRAAAAGLGSVESILPPGNETWPACDDRRAVRSVNSTVSGEPRSRTGIEHRRIAIGRVPGHSGIERIVAGGLLVDGHGKARGGMRKERLRREVRRIAGITGHRNVVRLKGGGMRMVLPRFLPVGAVRINLAGSCDVTAPLYASRDERHPCGLRAEATGVDGY